MLTSALAEISSSKTLVLEKAPLRPQRSVAVPHLGQLLMMQTLLTYISPTSSRGHFATTFSALLAGRAAGYPLRQQMVPLYSLFMTRITAAQIAKSAQVSPENAFLQPEADRLRRSRSDRRRPVRHDERARGLERAGTTTQSDTRGDPALETVKIRLGPADANG